MLDVLHSTVYISDADGAFTRYHRPVAPSGCKLVLEAASVVPSAASAAHGTDYAGIILYQGSTAITKNKTTNSGQAADSTNEAGASLAAGTETAFSLIGVGSQLEFSATTPLKIVGAKGGSGVAFDLEINFRWRIQRSAT